MLLEYYLLLRPKNRLLMRYFLLFIFWCFVWLPIEAQSSVLEKYIQLGIEQNLQNQKNGLAIEKQQYKIAEAKANRLPVVKKWSPAKQP